jgi:hypothetical protein
MAAIEETQQPKKKHRETVNGIQRDGKVLKVFIT